MSALYIRVVLRCMLAAMWLPALAVAGTVTIEKTFEGMTAASLMIVFVLSTLSGATALIQRIDRELRESVDKKLPRPTLFSASHMLGSWLGGTLAFVICEGQDVNDWLELGIIIVASFSGAKFIESIGEKYLAAWTPNPSRSTKDAP